VTVGPVVLVGVGELSEREVDELDVVVIDVVAGSPELIKVTPGGDPLFSNVCDILAVVSRVCWK
jgi:hypothetical protein